MSEDSLQSPLDRIEIAASIFVIHVSFLDLLGQLALALTGLLGTLQLETVLVHGEAHSLRYVSD